MNKPSIVDRARKISLRDSIDNAVDSCTKEERVDLVLAYLRGEVRQGQIVKVVWPGRKQSSMSTSFYSFIVHGVKDAYEFGKIKIV